MKRYARDDTFLRNGWLILVVRLLLMSGLLALGSRMVAAGRATRIDAISTFGYVDRESDHKSSGDNLFNVSQAPGCSSPQWDLDSGNGVNLHCWNNVYVVSINLRSPEIEVVPIEVNRPNSLRNVGESNGDVIAVINGDYTNNECTGTRCAQGLFYIAGSDKTNRSKLCTDGLKRRVLAISSDGRPLIDWWYAFVDNPHDICSNLIEGGGWATGYRYNIISGGPQITFDGSFRWDCAYSTASNGDCNSNGSEVVINEEHFGTSATNWWNRNQTIVGYTSDGNRLLLAVTQGAVTPQGVHSVLWQVAQHHGQTLKAALKFDGGSKSGLYYRRNNTYSINPDIPVANAWVVRRRTAPPPTATTQPPSGWAYQLFSLGDYNGDKFESTQTYTDLSAVGWNDRAESLRVNSGYGILACVDGNFRGTCGRTTGPAEFSDINALAQGLRDQLSSIKVCSGSCDPPTPPPSCEPNANQVALYVDANYRGQCLVKNMGEYANPSVIGLPNDSISSLKVGSNVRAVLCRDDNFSGGCEIFTTDDANLSDNSIGNDSVSSLRVELRCGLTNVPVGYDRCAEEGGFCNFVGSANVIYGANSCYTSPRAFTDGTLCTNDVFGDPLPGVHKMCFTDGSASTPTPPPTYTPTPTWTPTHTSTFTPTPQPTSTSTPTATRTPTPGDTPVVGVRIGGGSLAPNANLTVSVELTGLSSAIPLGAASIDILYDGSVVKAAACHGDPDGKFESVICNIEDAGAVHVSGVSTSGVAEDVRLARVTFHAVGQAGDSTALTPSVKTLANPTGEELGFQVEPGMLRVASYRSGDVNCDDTLSAVDALFILQYEVGLRTAANQCPAPAHTLFLPACDVNSDESCNVVDALFVLQCDVGLANPLCPDRSRKKTTVSGDIGQGRPVSVEIASMSLTSGDTVVLPITAHMGATRLGAVTVEISYDPHHLVIEGCTPDPDHIFKGASCNFAFESDSVMPDRARFSLISPNGVQGDLHLADIAFRAVRGSPAVSVLELDVLTIVGDDGHAMKVKVVKSEVQIVEKERNTLLLPAIAR